MSAGREKLDRPSRNYTSTGWKSAQSHADGGGGRRGGGDMQCLENKSGGEGECTLTLVCQPPPAPALNGAAARGCAARRGGPATPRLEDVILIHSVRNGRFFFFFSPLLFSGAWLVLTTQPNVKRVVAAAAAAAAAETPAQVAHSASLRPRARPSCASSALICI